ncbi:MAG TPA: serine/threonine-protein kinase [Polyangiaceae bacterium]|nr:serine/threonine-protein kinase [Polyangiaceae bacterium]
MLVRGSSSGLRSTLFGLSQELLSRTRERLRLLARLTLFGAVLSLAFHASRLAGAPLLAVECVGLGGPLLVLGSSLTVLLLLAMERPGPRSPLVLGLIFEVTLGYVTGIQAMLEESLQHGTVPLLTWAVPVVIAFPLIVPCPPRASLLVAAITGTGAFVGVALASEWGFLHATPSTYLDIAYGPVLGAVIAYFGSGVVHGLSRDYTNAKRAGSYRFKRRLGAGGMGEVWLAEHELLARPAAIKLLRPSDGDANSPVSLEAQQRFRREARATAQLRSPYTVEIYDYGVTEDGALFYAMELLNGHDLETLVTRFGPLPAERVVHILLQATCSLAEAHAHGVLHRDVKPANIYLCWQGLVPDFVKVLDFGLAKVNETALHAAGVKLTQAETLMGTPAFMSPEQITKTQELTPASDIYSLACVAYWLLSGQLPFSATNALGMMVQHVTATPALVSAVAPGPIPAELELLVHDCLAKQPSDRPKSMEIVYERLSRVRLTQAWTHARALEWWQHNASVTTALTLSEEFPRWASA